MGQDFDTVPWVPSPCVTPKRLVTSLLSPGADLGKRKWGSMLGVRLWEGYSCCGCLGRPQGRLMIWLDPPNGWFSWKGQSHVLHCSGAGCQVCALRWKQEHAAMLPCTALSSFLVELGLFACMKEGCSAPAPHSIKGGVLKGQLSWH